MGKIKPKDVKGGAIITANHNSFFDPIFGYCVFWRRIMHLVATKDLYNTKFKDFFFRHAQCIQVDKENFSMTCFHEVKEVLQDDKLVMIFPEGKVNLEQSEMLPFKSGAILMAHSTKKPIIPMYIVPGKKWYNRWYGVLGDPIDVREICGPFPSLEKINQVSVLLQETEEKLKEFYTRKMEK
jgi:1-acyl-sn-glycerol-3-phosphate acyltransferase